MYKIRLDQWKRKMIILDLYEKGWKELKIFRRQYRRIHKQKLVVKQFEIIVNRDCCKGSGGLTFNYLSNSLANK
jgi:hypothetical protein